MAHVIFLGWYSPVQEIWGTVFSDISCDPGRDISRFTLLQPLSFWSFLVSFAATSLCPTFLEDSHWLLVWVGGSA